MVPFVLLAASLAIAGVAGFQSGQSGLFLLALISALASLVLLVRGGFAGRRKGAVGQDVPARRKGISRPAIRKVKPKRYIVVDGSNVMHWNGETPQLSTVREVVEELASRGYRPGVIFDANVGWKIIGRYQDDAEVAMVLGLSVDQVLVVPKGVQADQYLLRSARDLGARVVTNDRFRDWAEAHPEVREPGFLLRGGYRDGKLWIAREAEQAVPA